MVNYTCGRFFLSPTINMFFWISRHSRCYFIVTTVIAIFKLIFFSYFTWGFCKLVSTLLSRDVLMAILDGSHNSKLWETVCMLGASSLDSILGDKLVVSVSSLSSSFSRPNISDESFDSSNKNLTAFSSHSFFFDLMNYFNYFIFYFLKSKKK